MRREIANKIIRLLRSRRFFIFILAFFAFESLWIAFSALYPQAFDEDFHFGLIKIYSHYWLPFLAHQPPGADTLGAMTRDPSYLYHYLMSFPYRFLALFVHSQTTAVIIFRLFNIAMFGAGLVLFRRLLLRVGLSRGLANVSILLFVLIPIVPQLAAQVNYDNLFFPLVAWVCLLTFDVIDQLRQRKPSASSILALAVVCLLASLVKYAFLPIFLTIIIFLTVAWLRAWRHRLGKFWTSLLADFKKQSWRVRILLPLILLVLLGMFAQRDGVNAVKYHTVVPDCASVLNFKECSAYSAWFFNYNNHHLVTSGSTPAPYNLKVYTKQWFYWMWYRLFFAVNGAASNFISYPPLPAPGLAAWILAVASLAAIVWWRRKLIYHNPYILFMLVVCTAYAATLFTKGYSTYKSTAVLENMNGRYLLPIIPLLIAIAALALSYTLRRWRTLKVLVALTVILLFFEGGGLFNFILRSDESWYWPNKTVVKVNNTTQKITSPVILKNSKIQSSNIAPGFAN